MSFPTVDFPEREWVVLDEDRERRQVHLVSAPAYIGCAARIGEFQEPGKNHRQQHFKMLYRNAAPTGRLILPQCRRVTESAGACNPVDPLSLARKVNIGVMPTVLALLAASGAE
jgi:hypothetical protein